MKGRIAVFGGTFDPPHIGHVEICEKLLAEKRYGIEKIIIMPCGTPPHKTAFTESRYRLDMCRLAFNNPAFEISTFEAYAAGKSYTYLTLEHIAKEYSVKPYYIAGGDSMRDMRLWKEPKRIAEASEIIAVGRGLIGGAEEAAYKFAKEFFGIVHISDITVPDFTSTEIRILNSCGLDISKYTGKPVADYIVKSGICREYHSYADKLRPLMNEERFIHSAYTAVTAFRLALRYGLDGGRAIVAGLIHDCAKELSETRLKKEYDITVSPEIAAMHPKVRHAPLGALLVQKLFGITDPEIMDAVKYHTSGSENMSPLTKLIFIADYIEPTRGYDDTAEMYKLAFEDIDKAVKAKYEEIERKKYAVDV